MMRTEYAFMRLLALFSRDASPIDLAPDELRCDVTVNEILRTTLGEYVTPTTVLDVLAV
jgi:hypothetical protein